MGTPPLERSLEQRLGLRERKKLRTRRAIQEHALRLFRERGYDATTVDQIAAAAEVSPSTVFRYFPTKEDTVLTDEYDGLIAESLRAQPAGLPPVEAIRRTLTELVGVIFRADRERVLDRSRLMLSVPALRARQADQSWRTETMIAGVLAERLSRPEDDFELRAFAAALVGVWQTAVVAWVEEDGERDLLALLDRGLTFLAAGCPLDPPGTVRGS